MDITGEIIQKRYRITSPIAEGGMSYVFMAEDLEKTGSTVAVKILKRKGTSRRIEDVIRFHSEATTISRINHPNIIKIHEVGETDSPSMPGMHYIVMEYIRGGNLFEMVSRKRFPDWKTALVIISGLCRALSHIHDNGIIHRDIKPGNIMILQNGGMLKTDQIKLIDFGLAQLKEFADMGDIEEVLGTFSYMSPEQTGLVKKNVDERSDLYSLGVVFYQLLTGELPFKGEDVSSLIHQHVAQMARPPADLNRDLPVVVSKMVMKLMEKDQEKRYQSAEGLLKDVEKVLNDRYDFMPGQEDRRVRLTFRTGLIGREQEMKSLRDLADRAISGEGRAVFIGGEAGRGKTRLLEELKGYVISLGGVFLTGKCFAGENKTPYGPFRDQLSFYLKLFNRYTENKKQAVKKQIQNRIGGLGRVILQLSKEMEVLLGDCPELVGLEPDRENERFLIASGQFFQHIAEIEKLMVLVFDDLQWSDEGSFTLMREIIGQFDRSRILIVGTYRDNELYEYHTLQKMINLYVHDKRVELMSLGLFDRHKMEGFISSLLFTDDESIKDISEFILNKSRGNPFFALEILKQLVNENALFYAGNRWNISYDVLGTIEISPTVIDVILNRISQLDEREMKVLSLASVIGRRFTLDLLFRLLDYEKGDIVSMIDKALHLQFLETEPDEKGILYFAHDRIKEAFYSRLRTEERKQSHLHIAKMMERNYKEDEESLLFDLAHHYIEGNNPEKSLTYAFPAGVKAKEKYANEEAIKYYSLVLKLLGISLSGLAEDKREMWIRTREDLGEIYQTIGKNDEAIALFNELLDNSIELLKKADYNKNISRAYFKKGDWKNCEEYGRRGLEILGERLPTGTLRVVPSALRELFVHFVQELFHSLFTGMRNRDKKDQIIVWFYLTLNWMYILSDIKKFIRSIMRMLNISQRRLGISRELGISLGAYASLQMALPLFARSIRNQNRAIEIKKLFKDEWGIAQSLQFLGFCYEWKGDYSKSLECFEQSSAIFRKIGDLRELGMTLNGMIHVQYFLGNYNSAQKINHEYYDIVGRSRDNYGISVSMIYSAQYNIERGNYEGAEELVRNARDLSKKHDITFVYCESLINEGRLLQETGQLEDAVICLEEAREIIEKNDFLKQYTVYLYPYLAAAYLKQWAEDRKDLSPGEKLALRLKAEKTVKKALRITKSWPTHYGTALRIAGKYYAAMQRDKRAEKYLLRAINHCAEYLRKYELGMGFFEYGRYLDHTGRLEAARGRLESAYRIFKEIGSRVNLQKTAEMMGVNYEEESTTVQRLVDKQKISSIIKVSQDISSILNLDELLEHVMAKAIEVTGAQRAYLLIKNDEGLLQLKASKNIINPDREEYSSSIVDEVIKSGNPVITLNAREERFAEMKSVVEYDLKSVLCIPIRHHEEIIGVCYLDNQLSSGVFTQEDASLLSVFMTQAAIAIENASFYQRLETRVEERTQELARKTSELARRSRELSITNEELIEAYSKLNVTYEELNKAYKTIKEDLALAKRIQENILPGRMEQSGKLETEVIYRPMGEVGGDIYDIFEVRPGVVRIFLADATGHGVQAALVTMIIKGEFEKIKMSDDQPSILLEQMNSTFVETYKTLKMFFTCIVLDVDYNEHSINYASAGHPTQYMVTGAGLRELPRTGRMVGLIEVVSYRNVQMDFCEGDKLILFTDGIFEEFNSRGEAYGEDRMKGIIQDKRNLRVQGIIEEIFQDLQGFMGNDRPVNDNDDITVIGLQYL